MTSWKYVGWDGPDDLPQVVVFPPTLQHSNMVPRDVVAKSAGFVTIESYVKYGGCPDETTDIDVKLFGTSDTLNLSPRPEDAEAFNISQ